MKFHVKKSTPFIRPVMCIYADVDAAAESN